MGKDVEHIKVVTDSSADLPQHLIDELDITVVPLVVTVGDTAYEDTSLSRDEFWRLADGPTPPKTSQPPSGVFREAFGRLVEQGNRVICTTITGRHSGTFNCAWSAAQAFGGRVTVFDSLSLSWGLAFQVMRAAQMAIQGFGMAEILETLRSLRARTHLIAELLTVENLRRGGRAARIMPAIERLARSLKIKPIINIVDGEIKLLGVSRSYQKGLRRVVQEVTRLGPLEALAVMHTRYHSAAERIADEFSTLTNVARENVVVGEAGPVLARHAGRGVIAAIGLAAPQ